MIPTTKPTVFTVYDLLTGRILQTVECLPEHMLVADGAGYVLGEGHGDKEYVRNGRILERSLMAIEVTGLQLKSVPKGATVNIDGTEYTTDGTDIDLEFPLPGSYDIRISLWPFQDWRTTIENPA